MNDDADDGIMTVKVGFKTVSFNGRAVTLTSPLGSTTIIPVQRMASVNAPGLLSPTGKFTIDTVDGRTYKIPNSAKERKKLQALWAAIAEKQAEQA
ncbi:MAG: hypothetical protein FWE15_20995 [Actinomycetia bacterium]|nr:hypothetical protein [Actinomycetes bacterium]